MVWKGRNEKENEGKIEAWSGEVEGEGKWSERRGRSA